MGVSRRILPPQPISQEDAEVSLVRLRVFGTLLLLLLLALAARLWYLQVLNGHAFRDRAARNRVQSLRIVAPRGEIEDAEGHTLVANQAQFVVQIQPTLLPRNKAERADVLALLARLLRITDAELERVMKRNQGRPSDPIIVAEGVDNPTIARIAENGFRLPGVEPAVEPLRRYQEGKLAAHLLGFIGKISADELNQNPDKFHANDLKGKSGIEQQYDDVLRGNDGKTNFETDAKGRRKRAMSQDDPETGATLRLTILREVQRTAESELNGRRGAIVAIDPRDGRILAMASAPSYDPNIVAKHPWTDDVADALNDRNTMPLVNRAVQAKSAPGSTFKIITASAGLATGRMNENTTSVCTGSISIGPTTKKCHGHHGDVNLVPALAKSCDVYFYERGFAIGPTAIGDWAKRFGLGAKTGVDLPTERAGSIPTPEGRKRYARTHPKADGGWYQGDTANIAIGQGGIDATPLQMALVAAGVANRGVIYRPHLLLRATRIHSSGKQSVEGMKPAVLHRLPLSTGQLDLLQQAMRAVIMPGGTSTAADIPGIFVAGKSGSAEKRKNGPTDAWFVCYAARPNQRPSIAVCVFIASENGIGLHGGEVAAPMARNVVLSYLKATKPKPIAPPVLPASPKLKMPATLARQ